MLEDTKQFIQNVSVHVCRTKHQTIVQISPNPNKIRFLSINGINGLFGNFRLIIE
jgi:hypothetical protein